MLLPKQVALAECCVLRDVLLLATLAHFTRALGTVPLGGPQLARLESTLLPQLARRLQQAALARWITSTPSTATPSGSYEGGGQPDLALTDLTQQLTLGGPPPRSGPSTALLAAKVQPAGLHVIKDSPLAAKLLHVALPFLLGVTATSPSDSRPQRLSTDQHQMDNVATRMVVWLQADSASGETNRHVVIS